MIDIEKNTIEKYEKGILVLQNVLNKIEWRRSQEYDRNIIDQITGRIKTPDSIARKLMRKNLTVEAETAMEKLNDIGGVRCICPYVDDVYLVRDSIREEKEIRILKEKDFICHPKKSGYRSLHMILEVPIPAVEEERYVKIELQIRTQIMHLWARLDHRKLYNKEVKENVKLRKILQICARLGKELDRKMVKTRQLTEKTDLT